MLPKIVFSDFDGTLTDHTEFSEKFLHIIHFLQQTKIPFVIVTGRSLSWAHFLMTHFSSLDVIIAEGGGVILERDAECVMKHRSLVSDTDLARLVAVTEQLKIKYPQALLSADSLGRLTDRAIELPSLASDPALQKAVCQLFDEHGINYSTSNVHLNFWSGNISKFDAMMLLMDEQFPGISPDDTVFFGDSLNDQSVFQSLKHTVGVANVSQVLEQMTYKPAIVLEGEHNAGPAGVLAYLHSLRS